MIIIAELLGFLQFMGKILSKPYFQFGTLDSIITAADITLRMESLSIKFKPATWASVT